MMLTRPAAVAQWYSQYLIILSLRVHIQLLLELFEYSNKKWCMTRLATVVKWYSNELMILTLMVQIPMPPILREYGSKKVISDYAISSKTVVWQATHDSQFDIFKLVIAATN
jgi:hypothetical protein